MTAVATDIEVVDHDTTQHLLREMVGCRLTRARFSYGDELRLRFTSNSGTGRWDLGARTSRWVLLSSTGIEARETDGRAATEALAGLEGRVVERVTLRPGDRALMIALNPETTFLLLPNKPHRGDQDVGLWELASPDGWTLFVRRDGGLERVRDDVPYDVVIDRRRRR